MDLEQALAKIAEQEAIIKAKDTEIAQAKADVIGARRKYKRLSELSDEEKAELTPEQIAEKEAMDEVVTTAENAQRETQELRAKEIAERRNNLAKRLVGEDIELQKKVLANFDRIKDADQAYLESEIEPLMNIAVNMLGDDKPQPVRQAVNATQGQAPVINPTGNEGEYADSEAGKGLAAELNLSSAISQS